MASTRISDLKGPAGVGIVGPVQPEPGTLAFELTDGTTTDPIELPPGEPGPNNVPTDEFMATKAADETSAFGQQLNANIEAGLDIGIPPAVADALANDPTVAAAAAGLAQSDAGLVRGGKVPASGILARITDSNGRATWLEANNLDGGPTEWAINLLLQHLPTGAGVLAIDAPYTPGASFSPSTAKTTALAGWGSSSMSGLNAEMADMAASHGMTYYNGASGGEVIEHHAARMGSRPARITFPSNTIPGSTAPITVAVDNLPAPPVIGMLAFAGVISGVEGTLSYASDVYKWTRASAGSAVTSPAGSQFISTEGRNHAADTLILNVGKNNLTQVLISPNDITDVGELVEITLDMVRFAVPVVKRVLVLGHWVDSGTPASSATRDRIYAYNDALKAALGPLAFFDTHAWITSSDLWTRSGLTPTSDDLADQAIGNKPMQVSADALHLNGTGNAVFRTLIQARMTALGWL